MEKFYEVEYKRRNHHATVECLKLSEAREFAEHAVKDGCEDVCVYMYAEQPADAVMEKWGVHESVITRVYREDFPGRKRVMQPERMDPISGEYLPISEWYDVFMIKDVDPVVGDDGERKVIVTLTNGTQVTIESCYESWQQYGGNEEELWKTVRIAEEYNDWLHGCGEDEDEIEDD